MSRTEMIHPQQAVPRNGEHHSVRSSHGLPYILKSGMCILSGGRDRQGGAVLTFPRTLPVVEKVKLDELSELLRYLTSIPSEEVRRHGFTVIIDMRESTWTNVKALLRALQECFPSAVRTIFVIKPEGFSHKPKSTSNNGASKYGFDVSLITVTDLPKYLNVADLTSDLGGSLYYDHQEWFDIRHLLDSYTSEASMVLDELDTCKLALLNGELGNDLRTTELLIGNLQTITQQLDSYPIEDLLVKGTNIYDRLGYKLNPKDFHQSALTTGTCRSLVRNPDFQAAIARLRSQLDRLHGIRGLLSGACNNRAHKLEDCRQWLIFEQLAKQNLEWLSDRRKTFLATYTDIGMSYATVQELEKQHQAFRMKCMDKFQIDIGRALEVGDKLLKLRHYLSSSIQPVMEKLIHERKTFQAGLNDRASVLELSGSFYRKTEEFVGKFPAYKKNCQPTALPQDSGSLDKLREQHKEFANSITHLYAEVSLDGKTLVRALGESGELIASDPALVHADFTRAANHIRDIVCGIQAQYRHLSELCTVKADLLEQEYGLRLYQEEAEQVIKWITEAADPFLNNNQEIGRNSEQSHNFLDQHIQFQKNAQNTYDNAERLLEASHALMERDGFNVEDAQSSSRKLENRVKEFEKRVTARFLMLSASCEFFDLHSSLLTRAQRVLSALEAEPPLESLESVVEAINRLGSEHQTVMESWNKLLHKGHAILNGLRDTFQSESGDYQHVKNILQECSNQVEAINDAWPPRRQWLEIYRKLRIFERSVTDVTGKIGQWTESTHLATQTVHGRHAEEELVNLETEVRDLITLCDQARDRGQEVLKRLSSSDGCMDETVLQTVANHVTDSIGRLTDSKESLLGEAEMCRMHLNNAIRLAYCNREGRRILEDINRCKSDLAALQLTLVSAVAAQRVHGLYLEIQGNINRLRDHLTRFQESSDDIIGNDIDDVDVARRLLETVMTSWQHLRSNSDELGSGIASGITFYDTAEKVCYSLQSLLETEYMDEQDWCSVDKNQGEKIARITGLVNRHQKQKEDFMKHCNNVRKLSDKFQKFIARTLACRPDSQNSARAVEGSVQKLLNHIKKLEDSVMHHWARRKRQLDYCHEFATVEVNAQKVIKWIQSTGEKYLATHTTAGSTQAATEALLTEHHEFVQKVKVNNDRIRTMMALAEDFVRNGHTHAAGIKTCTLDVEKRQRDFMSRLDAYRLQLETKLGCVPKPCKEPCIDRNSDGSLEGKLQEMSGKLVCPEEDKKMKQRDKVMEELLKTERVYVKDLSEFIQYFVKEAKSCDSGIEVPPGLSSSLHIVFGNIEEIFQFHNETFLKELEKYEMLPGDVAHCFATWTPQFDIYIQYCKDRTAAGVKVCDPVSVEYFRAVQAHYGLALDIGSYLIKPVQRITKYTQLLETLMKNCVDERHEIQDALELMRNVPKKANDAMNLSSLENYDEPLEQLGELMLVDAFQVSESSQIIFNKTHQRQLFFFELAILFTKRVCDGTKDPKFIFKNKIFTTGLTIICDKKESCEFTLCMGRNGSTSYSEAKIVLRAPSLDVKTTWMQKLRQVLPDISNPLSALTINGHSSSGAHRALVRNKTWNSRDSKDYEDSTSLEEVSGSNERHSIVSDHSSSTTTDSEKGLYDVSEPLVAEQNNDQSLCTKESTTPTVR